MIEVILLVCIQILWWYSPDLARYLIHLIGLQPDFSKTLRNLTLKPEAVSIGTVNSSCIGGLTQGFSDVWGANSMSHLNIDSKSPLNFFILVHKCSFYLKTSKEHLRYLLRTLLYQLSVGNSLLLQFQAKEFSILHFGQTNQSQILI